eukprot:388898_1
MGNRQSVSYDEKNFTYRSILVDDDERNQMQESKPIEDSLEDINGIIFAYLRKINNDAAVKVVDDTIPTLIWLYYNNDKFDTNYCPINVEISNDGKSIRKCKTDNKLSTCIFGETISNTKYNQYEIEIQWTKCVDCFCIGFIIESETSKIVNLLIGKNLEYMVLHYSQNNKNYTLPLSNYRLHVGLFRQNDIFKFVVNFRKNFISIWHNGVHAGRINLKQINYTLSDITMAFTLGKYQGEEIQIIDTFNE